MNKEIPLVSIICTTYNHEQYIAKALDGFLMQKTNFQFEIIVHDDASTDRTTEIIKQCEIKNPNLFVNIYQEENKYSKIGNGIWSEIVFPKARGKYIAICEGDDYWIDCNKLQVQVDFLEVNQEFSFCFHNASIYYVDKDFHEDFNKNLKFQIFKTKDLLLKDWFIPTASLVFRKDMLPARFPNWYDNIYSGDVGLELLLSTMGDFYYIDKKMSVYRKNAINSLSINSAPCNHLFKRIIMLRNFSKSQNNNIRIAIHYAILITRLQILRAKMYTILPFTFAIKDQLTRIILKNRI